MKDERGYYVDEDDPRSRLSRKLESQHNSSASSCINKYKKYANVVKKNQTYGTMTKAVHPPWYMKYKDVLPQDERLSIQPVNLRRSSIFSEKSWTKIEVGIVQEFKKGTSIRPSMITLEPKEACKKTIRTMFRGNSILKKNSKWSLFKNALIKQKLSSMIQERRRLTAIQRWKLAINVVRGVIRFWANQRLSKITDSVFHNFDIVMAVTKKDINTLIGLSNFDVEKYKSMQKCVSYKTKMILRSTQDRRTDADVDETVRDLRGFRTFSAFPTYYQKIFARIGQFLELKKDRVIIRQGQQPQYFYFVLSGKASALELVGSADVTKPGYSKEIKSITADSMFGEESLFGINFREYSVLTQMPTQLLSIAIDDYNEMIVAVHKDTIPHHVNLVSKMDFMKYFPIRKYSVEEIKNGNIVKFYFAPEKLVTRDIEASNYIYVIEMGSCKLYIQTKTNKNIKTLRAWTPPAEVDPLQTRGHLTHEEETKAPKVLTLKERMEFGPSHITKSLKTTSGMENWNRMQKASCWEKFITKNCEYPTTNSQWIYYKTLKDLEYIGLETMEWGDNFPKSTVKVAMVSEGCVMIGVKKSFLLENSNAAMCALVRSKVTGLPDSNLIKYELKRTECWERFVEAAREKVRRRNNA